MAIFDDIKNVFVKNKPQPKQEVKEAPDVY